MPLIFGTALVFLVCLAAMAGIFATVDRKGALMSQTGLGTLSFLLLVALVLYVAAGGGL